MDVARQTFPEIEYSDNLPMEMEELKDPKESTVRDYEMRLLTGSELMLRELKMSTPRE